MKRWLALCAVVVLPRLLVFPLNENLYDWDIVNDNWQHLTVKARSEWTRLAG